MKQMKLISLVLSLCFSLTGIAAWGQAAGDYGSAASGNWTANGTWVVCVTPGTWDGATPATTATASTTNVWIRTGHTVVFDTSSKNCNNLTIESGGKLYGNAANTSPKYINIYGTTIINNGEFGSGNDALGLKPFNTSLTLTGNAGYGISRIQPQVDGLSLVFDADALITYAGSSGTGSSAIYNNGKDNLTVTVNAGKTLSMGNNAYFTIATSGSAAPATGLNITLNINGTFNAYTNAHINLLNAGSKTSTINIGSAGVLNCWSNLLMPQANSTGILTVANGGKIYFPTATAFILGATTTTTINGIFDCGASSPRTVAGPTTIGSTGKIRVLDSDYPAGITLGSGSTVEYYGGNIITMPATPTSFSNLLITNYGGVSLGAAATVNNTFRVEGGCLFKTGGNTFTNSGTANIDGTFQIDQGGWATGNEFIYGGAGTLTFNNSTGFYGVSGTPAYWPGTNGPVNVTVQNTGGIEMQVSRTVTGVFQTATGIRNTFASDLSVSGYLVLNTGGYFDNFSPTYNVNSILYYNTGGTYNNGNEWIDGTDPGYGVPHNIILANTTVNLAGNRTIPGWIQITGKLILGNYNLTMTSPSSIWIGNDSFIVTNGTGSLTMPVNGTGGFPVGASESSYDPVTLSPTTPTGMSVNVGTTLPADAPANYFYAAKVWNITSDIPSTTVVNLTPSNPLPTAISDVIAHYENGNYTNVDATRTGNTYTATFSSFSPFVTGTIDSGDKVPQTKIEDVYFDGKTIHNPAKSDLQIFDSAGRLMIRSNKDINMDSNPNGIYIVKSAKGTLKIVLNK